jgi:PLP dependent protein
MLMSPQNLPENIRRVQERINLAARTSGRPLDSVTLLAVTKSQPIEAIRAAHAAGLSHFGESYVQEALGKLASLADLPLTWVHALDRLRIAERLSVQRPFHAPALNVCLQVNLAAEASKSGVAPADVAELVARIATLPRLRLRGLMCIPPPDADVNTQRRGFAELASLFASLNAGGAALDTLSMGMSADLEAAVMEGATIVRIGTALFGARN